MRSRYFPNMKPIVYMSVRKYENWHAQFHSRFKAYYHSGAIEFH